MIRDRLDWRERAAVLERSNLVRVWLGARGWVVLDFDFDVIAAEGLSVTDAEEFILAEQLKREGVG